LGLVTLHVIIDPAETAVPSAEMIRFDMPVERSARAV
jgi:hypothetical protein